MSDSDADPIAAVRDVLLADAGVSALVATRIYGGEVPEGATTKAMPKACIVLNLSGGPGRDEGYNEFGRSRVDVFCYGDTLGESATVYRAVARSLKQMRRQVAASVLLHSAEALSKGATARDPVTQWPTTLSSWSVLASEVVAA